MYRHAIPYLYRGPRVLGYCIGMSFHIGIGVRVLGYCIGMSFHIFIGVRVLCYCIGMSFHIGIGIQVLGYCIGMSFHISRGVPVAFKQTVYREGGAVCLMPPGPLYRYGMTCLYNNRAPGRIEQTVEMRRSKPRGKTNYIKMKLSN